jgi:Transposase
MKKVRFTEEQMVTILREADKTPVAEVAKKHKISEQTIYNWRRHFGTLEPVDIKRQKWPRLFEQLSPIYKWTAGRSWKVQGSAPETSS